jgi:hypothetical protein
MNTIEMSPEIFIIDNEVLPITMLPDGSRRIYLLARKMFDQTPAGGKIRIAFRQFPKTMQMIREDHIRFGFERMILTDIGDGIDRLAMGGMNVVINRFHISNRLFKRKKA